MKKRKGLLKSVIYCVVSLNVFFILQMLATLMFGIKPGKIPENMQLPIAAVSSAIFILIVALAFVIRKKNPLKELDCNRFSLSAGILPLFCALLFSLGYNVARPTWGLANALQSQTEALYTLGVPVAILIVVIVQPIAEEVLLRGVIMKRLAGHIPTWLAMCISAAIFSVMHLMVDASLVPVTLIGGLIFAYSYHRTRSLIPAVLAHMGANMGGMVTDIWDYSGINPYIIIIGCFVLSAILLICFSRIAPSNSLETE